MAFALVDARVELNAVNLTQYVTSITFNVEAEDLETTAFGGNGYRSRIAGLRDGSIDIEFNNDFTPGGLDELIWGLFGASTTIKVRPTSDPISTGNPEYSGPVLVTEVTPIDGGVGDLAKRSVSWPIAGPWTRATS